METTVIEDHNQDKEAVDLLEEEGVHLEGEDREAYEAAMADMRGELATSKNGLGHIALRAVEAHPLMQDDAKTAGTELVEYKGIVMSREEFDDMNSASSNRS